MSSTTKTRTIEVCSNAEWIANNVLDGSVIDLETWQGEAAADWQSLIVEAVERRGFEVKSAQGQRIMYHGWNGANTFTRHQAGLGTFDELTDAEWTELTDLAAKAADQVNNDGAFAFVEAEDDEQD